MTIYYRHDTEQAWQAVPRDIHPETFGRSELREFEFLEGPETRYVEFEREDGSRHFSVGIFAQWSGGDDTGRLDELFHGTADEVLGLYGIAPHPQGPVRGAPAEATLAGCA